MVSKQKSLPALIAWSFYDFGNSAFSAIFETFIFPPFFAKHLMENETRGAEVWGMTVGLVGFFIACIAPVVGNIADRRGETRSLFWVFTAVVVVGTGGMGWIQPVVGNGTFFLMLFGLATMGSELAYLFYNAMLPKLTDEIGKWSSWGWGFGYAGGIVSLVISLMILSGSAISYVFLFVSVWLLVFSLPLLLKMPKEGAQIPRAKESLWKGLKEIYKRKDFFYFFLGRMFFIDGLTTLFAFAGIYAASTFGMSEKEILLFAIGLNVTAGLGAFMSGVIEKKWGAMKMMRGSLIALFLSGSTALLVTDKALFWGVGLFLGLFVGPVQAASRSYLAEKAPQKMLHEMFGFFALSGRATSFMGPLLVSAVIALTGSIRIGMGVIILFFAIGLVSLSIAKRHMRSC